MNKVNISIRSILIIGIAVLFSFCTGQITKKNTSGQKSFGKIISNLDSIATLIYHDNKNNYWFANRDKGIYKYDGEIFTLFTKDDGLISHRIIEVQEGKNGNIYFDTDEGISVYDGQSFSTLEVAENTSSTNNWQLKEGDLWFRMGWDKKGPYRFDGEKLYELEFPKSKMEDEFYAKYPNASISPYGIFSIFKDSKGHIWFGTAEMGIYYFDGKTIQWMYERHLTETPEGGSFGIRSIVEDNQGYFWFCNTDYKYEVLSESLKVDGLQSLNYNRTTGIDNNGEETQYFLSMVVDKTGDIWMLNSDNGVWQNDGKKLIQHQIKEGEKDVLLSSIYKDQQGDLWVGSRENGAYKFNGESFEKY